MKQKNIYSVPSSKYSYSEYCIWGKIFVGERCLFWNQQKRWKETRKETQVDGRDKCKLQVTKLARTETKRERESVVDTIWRSVDYMKIGRRKKRKFLVLQRRGNDDSSRGKEMKWEWTDISDATATQKIFGPYLRTFMVELKYIYIIFIWGFECATNVKFL